MSAQTGSQIPSQFSQKQLIGQTNIFTPLCIVSIKEQLNYQYLGKVRGYLDVTGSQFYSVVVVQSHSPLNVDGSTL